MNEIQELKDRREQTILEKEALERELVPYAAALEDYDVMQSLEDNLRYKITDKKREVGYRERDIETLDKKIHRRETLANHQSLMAGYVEAIATWKADEEELNQKRNSINTRLEQVRQQAHEDMAKARQAETEAATAYAQAVAWGDVEGEKKANDDAQKAAKHLTSAAEHQRRQQLIITALEQEIVTIDRHISEAQQTRAGIEDQASRLANTVLEEKWNAAAVALLEVGGKLWAARRLIDRDPVSLFKLNIPEQGENFWSWGWSELSERSHQHSFEDVLAM
ncbi:chromosome segregation protein SMC [Pseudomonas lundensis]|uniref:chromosome segregation protein SMC n=1 Tax=Pseudomonas lundensis TaxID=86185 RepID=UPI000BA24E69|nr:chromosome segregation protein SMC [Pseudomonas lundensis]OZY51073.1 chromosome segregation protein SMC [Pseudomonas lundensis]